MQLTFYGGLDTIGGTILTVTSEESRLIFDFGLVYSAERSLMESNLYTGTYPLFDLLRLGRLPVLDGLYRRDALPPLYHSTVHTLKPLPRPYDPMQDDPSTTHVFISHLHLDHMGAVGWIHPDIPVVMSEPSQKLMTALDAIGESAAYPRPYRGIPFDKWQYVGNMRYQAVPVDHDIPGASALFIESENVRLIYSGDLRWHGKHPERIEYFIEKAHAFSPDLLLIEGTTVVGRDSLPEETMIPSNALPPELLTEKDMPEHLTSVFKDARGLIIVNPYHRNIDRLEAILEAATNTGRTLVLEPETAYLFNRMSNVLHDNTVAKNVMLRISERYPGGALTNTPQTSIPWLDEMRAIFPIVDNTQLRSTPEAFVVQNSWERLWDLLDWNLNGAIYVHTNGMPLGAFDPQFAYLKKVLKGLGIEHRLIGTGGHALPQHLLEIIRRIQPARIAPIHSLYPERLGAHTARPFFPKKHRTYTLARTSDGSLMIAPEL